MKQAIRIFVLAFGLLCSYAAVLLSSLADVTGDGSSHAVASSGTARWIQFVCPSTNTAAVRIGDSTVSTSRGIPCAAGGAMMLPQTLSTFNSGSDHYQLASVFYIAQSGDKVSIVWGQ